MLSISKPLTSQQAATYFNPDNYYLESDVRWMGGLAKDFHLPEKFTLNQDGREQFHETFKNLLDGYSPDRSAQLVESASKKHKDGTSMHRSGIDLTFSAPKSVSILACHDKRLEEAFHRALGNTVDHIEENFLQTRHKHKGKMFFEKTEKSLVASFTHKCSRELDPQLHAHCVVFNMTKSKNGQIMAMLNDQLYNNKMYLGQHFRNELAIEIKKLGYDISVTDRKLGFFEIKGIEKPILDEFSKRSESVKTEFNRLRELRYCDCSEKEIARWAESRVEAYRHTPQFQSLLTEQINTLQKSTAKVYENMKDSELASIAALNSRESKTLITQRAEKKYGKELTNELIKEIAEEQLRKFDTSIEKLCNSTNKEQAVIQDSKAASFDAIRSAVQSITENRSAFSKEAVLNSALKQSLGVCTQKDLEKAFQKFVKDNDVTYLGKKVTASGSVHVYSSKEIKDIEKGIIDFCKQAKTEIKVSSEISDSFINKTDLTLKLNITLHINDKKKKEGQEKFEQILQSIEDPNLREKLNELRNIAMQKGNDPSHPIIDIIKEVENSPSLKDIIEKNGYGFTKGQREFLKQIVSTSCQISACQGDAGTGKSFSMLFGKDLLQQNGFNVRGLAPTGKASDELARSAQLENSMTVDKFLKSWDRMSEQKRNKEFKKGKECFLIDEAGMLGSKKMHKLLNIAKELDAKMVFVGDRKQFVSIDQGRIFADLQDKAGVDMTIMQDVMRQKTDQSKAIVKAISQKDFSAAFHYLEGYRLPEKFNASIARNYKKGQMISFEQNCIHVPDGTQAKVLAADKKNIRIEYIDIYDKQKKTIDFSPREESGKFRVFNPPAHSKEQFEKLIHEIKDDKERINAVAQECIDSFRGGKEALVITDTNQDREQINQIVRAQLVKEGRIETKGTYTLREAHNLTGDIAVFADSYKEGQVITTNCAFEGINKNSEGRITAIDKTKNELSVQYTDSKTGELKTVVFNASKHAGKFSAFNEIKRELAVGERIAFLKNIEVKTESDKTVSVRNGQLAVITAMDDKGNITIDTGEGKAKKSLTFNVLSPANKNISFNNYLTYSYCLSTMKSQGMTSEHKLVWHANAQKPISANSFYVAITRSTKDLAVYTNDINSLRQKASKEQEKESTLDFDPEVSGLAASGKSDMYYDYEDFKSVVSKEKESLKDKEPMFDVNFDEMEYTQTKSKDDISLTI
jgi:conjugative relaxase-like TrwC/TraI family protein